MSQSGLRYLALLLLAVLFGCSWFVDPIEDEPRCGADAGVDAGEVCPIGLTCQSGRCKPACEEYESNCRDNVDNDCDDKVDEGDALGRDICGNGLNEDCDRDTDEGSDKDRDGVNWCPSKLGMPAPFDCDDDRPEVFPGAEELCDGLDNDCNGTIDIKQANGPNLCADDEVCNLGRCVKLTCASMDPRFACGPGKVCSAETGACVAVPVGCAAIECGQGEECQAGACVPKAKLSNGKPCLLDGDCLSGTCIDQEALRLPGGLRVCGEACCDDQNCATPGERCFASGTGARSCLPVEMFPQSAFKQCTNDSPCGKQVCGLERDQTLAAPYKPTLQLTTSVCVAPDPAARKLGEYCSGPSTCPTRACVTALFAGLICSQPCRHSAECKAFAEAAPFNSQSAYCRYIPVHPAEGTRTPDYAPICMVRRPNETGPKEWGEQCASSQECKDRGCVGAADGLTRCAPTCCDDSQCVTEIGRQGSCRPFKVGMGYEMRCFLPKAPLPSAQPR